MKKLLFLTFFLFFLIIAKAGTFNSLTTGNWNVATTWTLVTGVDANGIPDLDDTVNVMSGHTITLINTTTYVKKLTINAGGIIVGNNKRLALKGDFTNHGNAIGNLYLYMQTGNSTITSSTTYTASGDWYIQAKCTVAVGTVISKVGGIYIQNSASLYNFGSVTLKKVNTPTNNGRIVCSGGSNTWVNEANSFLSVESNFSGMSNNNLICTSPSTVTYAGNSNLIQKTNYYDLVLTAASNRSLTANINVLNNLTVSGSSTLTSNGTNSLRIGGNLIANGLISLGNSDTLGFNGTSSTPQVVSGTKVNTYPNLQIRNTGTGGGVVFNTTTFVSRNLFMRSGNCNANDKLTLKSDASATACLAKITNTAAVSFSGNLIIQNFMDNMLGQYYDMSSPISNSNVMDWDNEIYISGVGDYDGIGGPAGIDGTTPGFANSMHTYNETTNSFVAVTSTATALSPGVGYQLLLADNASMTNWLAKTIDTRGTPNYGNVARTGLTFTSGKGEGWHLLGNPYASHITYSLVTKSGMTNNLYYTDNGNYSTWPNGTIIPPYQGFYVETSGGTGSVTFNEDCKIQGNYTTEFFKQKAQGDIKLTIHSSVVNFPHNILLNFDKASTPGYDVDFDATYRKFPIPVAPALYFIDKLNNKNMIKNTINSVNDEVTIPLGIFTPKAGVYYIDVNVNNSDDYNTIWIENTKTGVKYDYKEQLAFSGEELATNSDFVLKLKKSKTITPSPQIEQLTVNAFVTENTLNLIANASQQTLKEVNIYDLTGKLVFSQNNIEVNTIDITKINITSLNTGVYVVSVIDSNGILTNKKIVK
jgi:hypothetical protein